MLLKRDSAIKLRVSNLLFVFEQLLCSGTLEEAGLLVAPSILASVNKKAEVFPPIETPQSYLSG